MPITKVTKDQIIQAACEIVRTEGLDSLNARQLATNLNGSVQLIYHNFATMDELTQAVIDEITHIHADYMDALVDPAHPYLAKGLSYVKFAREFPEFFKILFMSESDATMDDFIQRNRPITESAINTIGTVFPMAEDEYYQFHEKIWIFTHGIACLVATKTLRLSDAEVKQLLISTTHSMYRGLERNHHEKHH